MKAFALLSAGLAAMTVSLLSAKPAHAIPQTFVSGAGGGAACTRVAPCATFQAAHDVTDAGGVITCLDSGNFGSSTTTISKSITIDCAGTAATAFPVAGAAFTISTAGVVVRLRNLTIQGTGATTGILFSAGAALFVENCVIDGFNSGNARGISFQPASGTSKLFVSDSIIRNNDNAPSVTGAGILFSPVGTVRAMIDRVRFENNRTGIFAQAPSGQTTIVQLRDSVVSGSPASAISVIGSQGFAAVIVEHSSLMFNSGNGVSATGANAAVHLGSSTVVGNGGGLIAASGAKIFSYQNNQATGNNTDGGPTNLLTLK